MNTLKETYPVYEAVLVFNDVAKSKTDDSSKVVCRRTHIRLVTNQAVYAFRKLMLSNAFGRVPAWRYYAYLVGMRSYRPGEERYRNMLYAPYSDLVYGARWPSNLSLSGLATNQELERGVAFGNPGVSLLTCPKGSPRVGLSDESLSEAFLASEEHFVATVEQRLGLDIVRFWNSVAESFDN